MIGLCFILATLALREYLHRLDVEKQLTYEIYKSNMKAWKHDIRSEAPYHPCVVHGTIRGSRILRL